MTVTNFGEWASQVPLKTVGVLCATHIFGKNIESRQILLSGKRYFHNAVENVVGYVLNPILPEMGMPTGDTTQTQELDGEAGAAVRHIRDCFNFVFQIQAEYFKVLYKLMPERFRSRRTGVEFTLNQFTAKGPTLINSEKRYRILSRIDGAQPFDLNLNWNADFDWISEDIRVRFHQCLLEAQDAYAEALHLGEWYASRQKNMIMPLRTIMDDLSIFFDHLGLSAYLMARKKDRSSEETSAQIRVGLREACRHLERFTVDMLRANMFSIVMCDRDRLGSTLLERVVMTRAEDDGYAGRFDYPARRGLYLKTLQGLYAEIGFTPPAKDE